MSFDDDDKRLSHDDLIDRKFKVVIKEWEFIESYINRLTDSKLTIRGWAITVFSGVFGLSVYQDANGLMLIATVTSILFWLIDSMRQALQLVAFKREHEIEALLEDPSEDALMAFKAPVFGRSFSQRAPARFSLRIIFEVSRIILFGSMVALSLIVGLMA